MRLLRPCAAAPPASICINTFSSLLLLYCSPAQTINRRPGFNVSLQALTCSAPRRPITWHHKAVNLYRPASGICIKRCRRRRSIGAVVNLVHRSGWMMLSAGEAAHRSALKTPHPGDSGRCLDEPPPEEASEITEADCVWRGGPIDSERRSAATPHCFPQAFKYANNFWLFFFWFICGKMLPFCSW